jgi:hypothetical protein
LGFLSPHFSQICQGCVNLIYFFKEPAFCFIDPLYVFCLFASVSLLSALILIISFLLLVLGFSCSCFAVPFLNPFS